MFCLFYHLKVCIGSLLSSFSTTTLVHVTMISFPRLAAVFNLLPASIFYTGTRVVIFFLGKVLAAQLCLCKVDSLQPPGLQPARLLCPWNSPGKSIGVGSQSVLQGIFPTKGSNLGLLHCKRTLYSLSHQGNASIMSHSPVLDPGPPFPQDEIQTCRLYRVFTSGPLAV